MSKTWNLLPRVYENLFDQLLHNRGLTSPEEIEKFLNPTLTGLIDPHIQFPELKKAVDRIRAAIEKKEMVYIYGDYDVDGLTSTAILWENLKLLGANVLPYIPHREKEGYGLNKEALKKLKDEGTTLVISVDCGITAIPEAKYAQEIGLDLIITDHHRKPEKLPEAYAIVHIDQLCGAGIAFKIAYALDPETATQSLDLAALGTVADLQPITGENRIITKFGLEQLRENRRAGLKALLLDANVDPRKLRSWDISFNIAPKLNAIGRMEHAIDGLRLLLTKNVERAYQLADILKVANKSRQEFTQIAVEEARQIVAGKQVGKVCFVIGEAWREGVIGLVASRLVDEVSVPVFAITKLDGYAKGSARSFNGYNIIEAISKVDHLLVDYGGHPGAAGFTLKTEKIDEFCVAIEAVFEESYSHEKKEPEIVVEAALEGNDLNIETVTNLSKLEPFGLSNTQPIFLIKKTIAKNIRTLSAGKHLKFTALKDNNALDVIGFSLGSRSGELQEEALIDVVGTLEEDTWNGQNKLQLVLKDFKTTL